MGRFVDAKEGKSERQLREREGFITVMWLDKFEPLSCFLPVGKHPCVMCHAVYFDLEVIP